MAETVIITTTDLEPAVRLRDAFQEAGYAVELLTSSERVADVAEPVLLILTGGLEEKRAARLAGEAAARDHLPILALADTPAQARHDVCARLGAAECFVKPVDPGEVALVGRRLMERRRLRRVTGIVGETEEMHELLERVLQFAPVNATVLITGESGTGKELVARGIHALSSRRHRPFIAANVAALADTLLESELFGHEKGAFTGAIAQRKGLFELAHRGTLFLDEIGEMPLTTQTKLLRVLEEREFLRVGGETPLKVDVRVIAATNRELRHDVELGEFRRDLYYRLNVLHIRMPPLRDRRADIPILVDAFVREFGRLHDRPQVALSPEAMGILMEYDWPGNVRELRNLIESMVVLAPGRVIRPEDIPPAVRSGGRVRATLPMVRRESRREDGGAPTPELEFLFRTLVDLRMDVEDLQTQFEEFRRGDAALPPRYPPYPYPLMPGPLVHAPGLVDAEEVRDEGPDPALDAEPEPEEDEAVVVYRTGMTLEEMEKQAITAALKEVKGNRRRAAEILGIGERTLYRKIKEYDIPL